MLVGQNLLVVQGNDYYERTKLVPCIASLYRTRQGTFTRDFTRKKNLSLVNVSSRGLYGLAMQAYDSFARSNQVACLVSPGKAGLVLVNPCFCLVGLQVTLHDLAIQANDYTASTKHACLLVKSLSALQVAV